MPDAQTLSPFERQLCRGLLALAGVGIAVLLFYQRLVATVCGEFMSFWTQKSLPALAAGKMPPLDLLEVLFACLFCGLLGALFLISQYLAQLVGRGRLLRLSTLWLWTVLFGVLNAVLSASVLPFVIAPGFGFVLMSTAGVCLYFGTQAWRIRRKEERALKTAEGNSFE